VTQRSPTAQRRRLGRLLRELRERAHISGDNAAAAVDRSASWISRIESGQTALRQRELRDLLVLYRADNPETQLELERLAAAGRQQGWWNEYAEAMSPKLMRFVGLESDATSIFTFQDRIFPGLLQTTAYMQALHALSVPEAGKELVDARIRIRQKRQKLLDSDEPPHFIAIIDEAVLKRDIGGREVMRDQLRHLLQVARQGLVELRILSFANLTMPLHSFIMLHFEADPPAVFVDTLSGGFLEEGDTIVREYQPVAEHLLQIALATDESRKIIQRAINDLS